MSVPEQPDKVKLFLGMLTDDSSLFDATCKKFYDNYGHCDYESEVIPFSATDFYRKEMGSNLIRKFYSFENLIIPEEIIKIKYQSFYIEKELSTFSGNRRINIDPGYMCLGKVILSTFKDHQHRIYLNDGVYAECTLRFRKGRWDPWEWTFPDYQTEEYNRIFLDIRNIYYNQLNPKGM